MENPTPRWGRHPWKSADIRTTRSDKSKRLGNYAGESKQQKARERWLSEGR